VRRHFPQRHRDHFEQSDLRAGEHRLHVQAEVLEDDDQEDQRQQAEDDEHGRRNGIAGGQ
jgi:hypothetical protein